MQNPKIKKWVPQFIGIEVFCFSTKYISLITVGAQSIRVFFTNYLQYTDAAGFYHGRRNSG